MNLRILALLAAAFALSGCGATVDPLHAVTRAATKTLALRGVSYTMTPASPRLSGTPARVLGGRAAYDLAAGVGYEAITLDARTTAVRKLYLDYRPGAVYVAPWPAPAGALPAGKVWVGVAFPRVGGAVAEQAETRAVELPLAEVAWGARSASPTGTRVVGHVPLDGYVVTVDLARALAGARRAGRTAVAAAIAAELHRAPTRRVSVWVNGPGYVALVRNAGATFSLDGFSVKLSEPQPRPSETVPWRGGRSLWALATTS